MNYRRVRTLRMRMDHVVKVDQRKRKGQSVEEENRERNYTISGLLLEKITFYRLNYSRCYNYSLYYADAHLPPKLLPLAHFAPYRLVNY